MSCKTIQTPIMYRHLDVSREAVNVEARTAELSFSSDHPVDRFFGREILGHEASEVRLDRLRSGAAVLWNHNRDDHIGTVEDARIEGGRGQARVRFGSGALAAEKLRDVADGILRHVSVGYRVNAMRLESSEDGVDTFRITDWEPLEISLVTIPADPSVGVGRDAPAFATRILSGNHEDPPMPTKETDQARDEPKQITIDVNAEREQIRKAEMERIRELSAYGEHYPQLVEDVQRAIKVGVSVDEFARDAMDKLYQRGRVDVTGHAGSADIGMTRKEERQWSLVRAINASLTNDWREAGLELEASRAVAEKVGKSPQGFFVPSDVRWSVPGYSERTQLVGTAADGGNLVGTDHLGDRFVDALRERLVTRQLGATVLTGLQGNIQVPALNARTATYWVAENAAPTKGAPTFRQIPMAPKTLGAWIEYSRKLLIQSDPSVEAVLRRDLVLQMARGIDLAAIQGGGTNEPDGILETSGIGDVAHGTNGGAPTWVSIVNLIREVSIDDALMGRLAFLTNPAVVAKLRTTPRQASGVEGNFIMPPESPGMLGYQVAESNLVPATLTKGTGTNLSALIFGDFSALWIGEWGALDLLVDPYSQSTTGATRIVTFMEVDIAVRHAQAFAAAKDLITT